MLASTCEIIFLSFLFHLKKKFLMFLIGLKIQKGCGEPLGSSVKHFMNIFEGTLHLLTPCSLFPIRYFMTACLSQPK